MTQRIAAVLLGATLLVLTASSTTTAQDSTATAQDSCECRVEGMPTTLFRGAILERLRVVPEGTGCKAVSGNAWGVLTAEPDYRVATQVEPDTDGEAVFLALHSIPANLSASLRRWTFVSTDGFQCEIEIGAADGIKVVSDERGRPRLSVAYLPVREDADQQVAEQMRAQLGQLHSGESPEGWAVADPGPPGYVVENRAAFAIHPDLRDGGANHEFELRGWEQTQMIQDSAADSVGFFTTRDQHQPLSVRALYSTHDGLVYVAEVQVALGARVESLPLPLGEALFVWCGESDLAIDPELVGHTRWPGADIAAGGETRAIEETDLESGACRLHYAPSRLKVPLNVVPFFGRQEVLVTVSRDGGGEATVSWPILDPSEDSYVVLPSLTSGSDGTGAYRVSATINGAHLRDIVYRPPSATNGHAASALSDHEFRAQLRPRGPFGWRSGGIRTFVTFPIEFVGFRFNARGRDLRASSDSTTAQITTPRLGVLVAVEPWNYDAGANPWAVPTRFMAGLHLFELSQGSVAPSMVVGASFTFPLIDLPKGKTQDQLGTDLAVGMFWEVDLQERSPFRDGNHFVVTLGLNVLSVFGAK